MTDQGPVRRTFRAGATIRVALDAERTLPLFTARGERAWVPGWHPDFPAGEPPEGEDEREGAVFITRADGHETTWVVAARGHGRIRYARVTPGLWAGTVDVRVVAEDEDGTAVEVTYDLTSLSAEGDAELERSEDGFAAAIEGWERLIADALAEDPG
jgi:hypothetical protein